MNIDSIDGLEVITKFSKKSGLFLNAKSNLLVTNPNIILFSERNSEALDDLSNSDFGNIGQDDYDAWVGESALVRWGSGNHADAGWIRYNRHQGAANYIFTDGHVARLRWREARKDQFPDHRVRNPLAGPPE